jgi:hypothetical protein
MSCSFDVDGKVARGRRSAFRAPAERNAPASTVPAPLQIGMNGMNAVA